VANHAGRHRSIPTVRAERNPFARAWTSRRRMAAACSTAARGSSRGYPLFHTHAHPQLRSG
jgi:hypothetical protein